MSQNDRNNSRRPRNDRRNQGGRNDQQNDRRGPPVDRHPVLVPPQPKPEWKARTVKEIRDADWFLHTPHFARPTAEDMAEKKNYQLDIDQCLIEGCAIWQLRNPRSILGKEAPKLHAEQIAKAANAGKEAAAKAAAKLTPAAE